MDSGLYFYQFGRDALLAAVMALNVSVGEAVIVPAYICNSTIEPLRKAGYQIVFVDIEPNFQFNTEVLLDAINACNAKAVLVVHYFGFQSDVDKLIRLLYPLGVRIIEDACHCFLMRFSNTIPRPCGDAIIYSMRKTLPVPDGGALYFGKTNFNKTFFSDPPVPAPQINSYIFIRAIESLVARIGLLNIYSCTIDNFKGYVRNNLFRRREISLTKAPQHQQPSSLLWEYLSEHDRLEEVKNTLILNYNILIENGKNNQIKPYFDSIPVGSIPQWAAFFDETGCFVDWLRKQGVGACRWPWKELPADVSESPKDYPTTHKLNRTLALLPVHQGIGKRQRDKILKLFRNWARFHVNKIPRHNSL